MRTIRIAIASVLLLIAGTLAANAQTQYKDIFDMIRGKVPGVQVGEAGPGAMPRIIIRGIGTNTDKTDPLFLVDGVQTENIANIDPNNVYEIDIIKDGTSSIYGMQGANGVISITTKGAVMAAQQEAEARKAARKASKAAKKAK